jgi:hypothetical protein
MDAQTEPQSPISPDWAGRFLAGWNSRNTDRLLGLAAHHVTWVDPFIPGGMAQGKAAVSEWLAATWSASPDLTFEVAGEPFVSIDGKQLAITWKGAGTFTGRLDPAGLEPTGARVDDRRRRLPVRWQESAPGGNRNRRDVARGSDRRRTGALTRRGKACRVIR